MRRFLGFIACLIGWSAQAQLADSTRVLRMLDEARIPRIDKLMGYTYSLPGVLEALQLADSIGWQRGRIRGHMAAFLAYLNLQGNDSPAAFGHFWRIKPLLSAAAAKDSSLFYYFAGQTCAGVPGKEDSVTLCLDIVERIATRDADTAAIMLSSLIRAQIERHTQNWVPAFRQFLITVDAAKGRNAFVYAHALNAIGMVRGRLGDLEGSERDFNRSLAISDSMGFTDISVRNHNNRGYIMQVNGRWREALDAYRKAYRLVCQMDSAGDPTLETSIGYMLLRLDSLDQAQVILDELFRTGRMVGTTYEQEFNVARARLLFRRGRYREALELAHHAFNTRQMDEDDVIKRDASRVLAEAYKATGQYRQALEWTEITESWEDTVGYRQQATTALRHELVRDMDQRVMKDSLQHQTETFRLEATANERMAIEKNRRNIVLSAGAGVLLLAIGLWWRLRFTARTKRIIEREKQRSDELLLNILPEEVAEELKNTGAAEAKHFDNATILFTDFKGFTEASERLTPQELVEELNTCFKAFDGIITARGIEKIKTIGDAYMCAGGLPDPKSSSPADVVHAALEMQAFMIGRKKERDAQGLPAFEMRLGIHTGPVVAGIVGVKKFQYDIWGDTVNTASRMESSGEVGQVNISEATYALVRNAPGLSFTPRGKVQAKGKGEMEMYFVGRSLGRG